MNTLFNLKEYSVFPDWDEYEVFHDESKKDHIIHGYLFIPTRIKNLLISHVNQIRAKYNCDSKLHYNDLTGTIENIKHKTTREILILMEDALRSKRHDKRLWGITPPRCKFVLFFKKSPSKMNSNYFNITDKKEIYTRKVETLLRIGLKGGLHHLFDKDQKIKVSGFYTDGKGWSRPLDKERILKRLYCEKECFIDFEPDMSIIPVNSDHKDSGCSDKDRANLLQITDLLLGAIKACIFPCNNDTFKYQLAAPIRNILAKQKKRKSFFFHSGHYKSFCLTRSSVQNNGKWEYTSLLTIDEAITNGGLMNKLPFMAQ